MSIFKQIQQTLDLRTYAQQTFGLSTTKEVYDKKWQFATQNVARGWNHCAVLYEKKAKLALGLWLVPSPRYFAKLLKCRIRRRIASTGSIETNHARLIRAEATLAALPNNT